MTGKITGMVRTIIEIAIQETAEDQINMIIMERMTYRETWSPAIQEIPL